MASIFNNIWPVSVKFNVISAEPSVMPPPLNQPNPNWQLPAGSPGPGVPQAVIPAAPGNLKAAINNLPSIFTIKG